MNWTWLRHGLIGVGFALVVGYAGLVAFTGSVWLDTPAAAQAQGKVPGSALGNSSDAEFWRKIRRGVSGTVSIPDKKAGVLVQSDGDAWRVLRNGPVSVWGGWLLLATVLLLAVFFALRGRIRIQAGFSGRLVRRFTDIEVFTHWMTASSFVVLGLTGLNVLYGKFVLLPVIGPEAFATLSLWGKYAHDFLAFPFMVGLIMMTVLWVRSNIWDRHDLGWLLRLGGLFSEGVHPPAAKFNLGQKLIFWAVILGGIVMSLSGLVLLLPFAFGTIQDMQLMQVVHAVTGLVLIAIMIAHIYIGSLGMEGAFSAVGTGLVDENWAGENHSAWEPEPEEGTAAE
jgi:formate dehydrogenase subunit gamma